MCISYYIETKTWIYFFLYWQQRKNKARKNTIVCIIVDTCSYCRRLLGCLLGVTLLPQTARVSVWPSWDSACVIVAVEQKIGVVATL